MSYEQFQDLEQIRKWTTSRVREDLCNVHEAYQYFRYKYKVKPHQQPKKVEHEQHIDDIINENERNETEDKQETEEDTNESVTLGVQHRGKISTKEASRILRAFWPKNIVKDVKVRKRMEIVDVAPDYQPLWVVVKFARNYTFENYLDWPAHEDNWPDAFDKGLFREELDWC